MCGDLNENHNLQIKSKNIFLEDCDLFFVFSKLGKKSPKFFWEWGQILAPENTQKIPGMCLHK